MPENFIYLQWLAIFIILPTALLWVFEHSLYWKYRRVFLKCILIFLAFGLVWDAFAVKAHIWRWPEECCVLPRVYEIPGEEILWIVSVTISIVSVTLLVRERFKTHHKHSKKAA